MFKLLFGVKRFDTCGLGHTSVQPGWALTLFIEDLVSIRGVGFRCFGCSGSTGVRRFLDARNVIRGGMIVENRKVIRKNVPKSLPTREIGGRTTM